MGEFCLSEICTHRRADWPLRGPHPLSGNQAALYLSTLSRDIIRSFDHNPDHMLLAPPRIGTSFHGRRQAQYGVGFIRGMASGEAMFPGYFVRAQELYPQLTRLFVTTHEAFHHVDRQMELSLGALARQFPHLADAVRDFNSRRLTRTPGAEADRLDDQFMDSLSHAERSFLVHTSEVFSDAAAALYMLDRVRHPQAREFLTAWQQLRSQAHLGDPLHASNNTIAAVIAAYDRAVAEGRITPGAMTVSEVARFVQPFVEQNLDPMRRPATELELRGPPRDTPKGTP